MGGNAGGNHKFVAAIKADIHGDLAQRIAICIHCTGANGFTGFILYGDTGIAVVQYNLRPFIGAGGYGGSGEKFADFHILGKIQGGGQGQGFNLRAVLFNHFQGNYINRIGEKIPFRVSEAHYQLAVCIRAG